MTVAAQYDYEDGLISSYNICVNKISTLEYICDASLALRLSVIINECLYLASLLTKIMGKYGEKDRKCSPIFSKFS